MEKSLFYLFIITILIFSCKEEKDQFEQAREDCREDMTFNCIGVPTEEIYFKAEIDGTEVCIGTTDNTIFYNRNGIGTVSTTSASEPTFTPSAPIFSSFFAFSLSSNNGVDRPVDYAPSVDIQTPYIYDTITYPKSYYLDSFLIEGVNLPLKDLSSYSSKSSGFQFGISWNCEINDYELGDASVGVRITPREDDEDAIFMVSNLEKKRKGDTLFYDITFQIEFDLYHFENSRDEPEYFGKLENGEYRTKFTIIE